MSFRYRKVVPSGFFFKTYGYQRVSPDEMRDIIARLQKQTHSRELAHSECLHQGPVPPRAPSVVCKRAESARSEIRNPSTRPRPCSAPPEETDRMFRRIGKHTLSHRAALGKLAPSYESDASENKTKEKPRPKDQAKSIQRIRRQTTAYKYRCGEGSRNDPNIVKYQEYDFSDGKTAPPQEVEEIIDRVRVPTIASEGGAGPMCPKRRDSIGRTAPLSKPLPLISGLPRSKTVNEIVDRLAVRTPTHIHRRCRPFSAFDADPRTAHVQGLSNRRAKSARPGVYRVRVPLSTDDVEIEENAGKQSPHIIESDSDSNTVRSRSPRDQIKDGDNAQNDSAQSAESAHNENSAPHEERTSNEVSRENTSTQEEARSD